MSDGYELGTAETFEEVLGKRTDAFDDLSVSQLETQFSHKISVIPESDGITERWWAYTDGVSRVGPEAEVPAGEEIRTSQTGEYVVGIPALAGGGIRVTGEATDPTDDCWAGFGDRQTQTPADGVGVGYAYFDEGEGDLGGADSAGGQEYVWFRSSVAGVSNLRIPRDEWNGDNLTEFDIDVGELFHAGGFLRLDHTFYDQGQIDVNWGVKTSDGGLEIVTLHSLNVKNQPMWGKSDLRYEMATEGVNLTGYLAAAHYKAGDGERLIRFNSAGRDGSVLGGPLSGFEQGDIVPIISLKLRDEWESVNVTPIDFNADFNDKFYPVLLLNPTLVEPDFNAPNSELAGVTQNSSEYAVLVDNTTTEITDPGRIEYLNYADGVAPQGPNPAVAATASGTFPTPKLEPGEIVALAAIIVDATEFQGASMNWGANF